MFITIGAPRRCRVVPPTHLGYALVHGVHKVLVSLFKSLLCWWGPHACRTLNAIKREAHSGPMCPVNAVLPHHAARNRHVCSNSRVAPVGSACLLQPLLGGGGCQWPGIPSCSSSVGVVKCTDTYGPEQRCRSHVARYVAFLSCTLRTCALERARRRQIQFMGGVSSRSASSLSLPTHGHSWQTQVATRTKKAATHQRDRGARGRGRPRLADGAHRVYRMWFEIGRLSNAQCG